VFFHELVFVIPAMGYAAEEPAAADEEPGIVPLVGQKSGADSVGVEVMVIVPFTCDHSRPGLINGEVGAVEVDAVFALVFSAAVSVEIKGANSHCPDRAHSEDGDRQGHAAHEIKSPEPEGPVEGELKQGREGMADRSPFLILLITVQRYDGVFNQFGGLGVILPREITSDRLVIHIGQEAVKKAPINIVRISRFLGNVMVDVVRDHVNLFRHDFDDQVADDEKPDAVGEGESVVRGVSV